MEKQISRWSYFGGIAGAVDRTPLIPSPLKAGDVKDHVWISEILKSGLP